jgi:tetratricopeptide (TPR) repeat protein
MNEETYIRFENYLANEMTSEEKTIFEEQLKNDASFKESFELYKDTTQFLDYKFSKETSDFKENLKSISNQHLIAKKETKVIAFKPWYYAVAASIVVVIGTWMMMQNNADYSDYNQHETAVFLERSLGDENLKKAQEAFNAKDYKKAVEAFDKIQDFRKPELQYFYAIALIETNNYAKAELFLDQLRKGNSVYKEKATWYLALSYLKQEKLLDCKSTLKEIPVDAEDYDKGQELLKKLD